MDCKRLSGGRIVLGAGGELFQRVRRRWCGVLPRLLEGSDRNDPLALIAYYKVIALPKTGKGESRIFQLDRSKIEKHYFLEEFSRQTITLAKTYKNELPDIRAVVADAVFYLDRRAEEQH